MQDTSIAIQPKQSALALMATRYNLDPTKLLDTLKGTVFKGATNEELAALVVVANEYHLNPFLKQIYAFPGKGGGITPVVSIDGWIAVMNRREDFDGIEFEMVDKDGKPHSCTAIVRVKGRTNPVKVTEYFDECFRNTEPWKAMPRRMLRHKACAQGVRLAFGMAGVYDEDEARTMAADPLENAKPAKVTSVQSAPEPQFSKAQKQADDQVPGAEIPATIKEPLKVEPKADAPKPSNAVNLPKLARGFLKLSGIAEPDFIAFLHQTAGVDDSLASLEDIAEMSPAALKAACDNFKPIEKAIKGAKSQATVANGGLL